MIETLFAMIRVSIAWLALWIVFSGVGLWFCMACGRKRLCAWDLLMLPWLGWASVVMVLQLWHCFLPVDARAITFVSLVGIAGLALNVGKLGRVVHAHRSHIMWCAALLVVLALWMANQSVKQPRIYDSGLYHLNCVRWAYSCPIVPGLGNLHGRLAFNNSSFLYTAMLDAGFFKHKSHHLASGFLMICLMMPCLCSWWRVLRSGARDCKTLFYAFAFAPLLVWTVTSGYASSPSPDVPCFLLALLIGGELIGFLSRPRDEKIETVHDFHGIVLLSLIGLTVKLSFAFFAAAACAVTLLEILRRKSGVPWKHFSFAGVLSGLVVIPWMIRGVLMSGFPAYPAKIFRFTVDWAMSEASAEVMVMRIKSWARIPHVPPEEVMGNLDWVKPWFMRVVRENLLDFTLPLITLLVAVAILLRLSRRSKLKWADARWLVLLPSLAGLVVWLSAPDPRYQGSLLWVLAIGLLVLMIHMGEYAPRWSLTGHALVIVALLMNPLDLVRSWKDPSPARRVEMSSRTTLSGLKVLVPTEGDQSWDADLPATPYFSPRLRLRVPGDMSRGFTKRKQEGMSK